MKLQALIKDATITFENLPYARHHLKKMEGKKVTIDVQTQTSRRSLNQNALMWMWFTLIAQYTGHTPEEIHIIVKGLYCPKKTLIIKNKTYTLPKGTSELTKGEMVEVMLHIEAMAADLGVILPSPEEWKRGLDNATLLS